MKKKLSAILILFALFLFAAGTAIKTVSASADTLPEVKCKSAYLMDYNSCTCVFAKDENERLPIASMCKIMTLVICFDEISSGNLTLEDDIPVSEHAASMGGSQVFLESGNSYKAGELIKSITVCSANDSCVAMAEHISGSDSAFVDRMNARAKELGANDTLFANCTGLPKETQYSTAHDVALMLRELLSNEEYYSLSKVWTEKFVHSSERYTEMTNTNKLIRSYSGCDGGKTGFTNQAGFCLAATAKRGDMRIISVAIGSSTSAERFSSVANMFDYAFANYTQKIVVDSARPLAERVYVRGGKVESIEVAPERNGYVFSRKNGEGVNISIEFSPDSNIAAPIKKGERAGEIIVFKNGVECDRISAVALSDCLEADVGDYYKRIASEWNF